MDPPLFLRCSDNPGGRPSRAAVPDSARTQPCRAVHVPAVSGYTSVTGAFGQNTGFKLKFSQALEQDPFLHTSTSAR